MSDKPISAWKAGLVGAVVGPVVAVLFAVADGAFRFWGRYTEAKRLQRLCEMGVVGLIGAAAGFVVFAVVAKTVGLLRERFPRLSLVLSALSGASLALCVFDLPEAFGVRGWDWDVCDGLATPYFAAAAGLFGYYSVRSLLYARGERAALVGHRRSLVNDWLLQGASSLAGALLAVMTVRACFGIGDWISSLGGH